MKYRRLGHTGPQVSAVSLGRGSQPIKPGDPLEPQFISAVHRAMELGVNFIDTSDLYWAGAHEVLVGRAVKGRRDKVLIATKFGNIDLPDGKKGMDGRPEYVFQACEASLKRLNVDVIDVYYAHRVDPNVPIEDTVGAMAQLVSQGKVRFLGICEATPKAIKRAHREHPLVALQTEYSLWSRDVEKDILPACRELGIGYVAYAPLGRGLLTGNIKTVDDLRPNDRRRKHPRFFPENLARNIEMVRQLEEIAAARGATAAQLALAWLLAQGDDIVAIPGTNRAENVELNAAAADMQLKPDELKRLKEIFAIGAGAGERYPAATLKSWGLQP
jgi:aryl-alcohol dehydrogenase-like predicted oxidoreductase